MPIDYEDKAALRAEVERLTRDNNILRGYANRPENRRQWVEGGCWLFLNVYQLANLKAALKAAAGNWIQNPPLPVSPLNVFNNGDWLGELIYLLPDVEHHPNRTAEQLVEEANARKG